MKLMHATQWTKKEKPSTNHAREMAPSGMVTLKKSSNAARMYTKVSAMRLNLINRSNFDRRDKRISFSTFDAFAPPPPESNKSNGTDETRSGRNQPVP
eukprot:CAMPEP_0182533194 /NCGR_PEP_ID=MMETSP1323-20130603/13306_1 /TAXON_ID=236787 /ORGANISM="Florenciella parvula, Strain RCC1693" /LENGTH=97 /DNA_ID=CAMNT_0024743049 /DNA_START=299 /DNA_END=592 /DNA_ORIENTATION=-